MKLSEDEVIDMRREANIVATLPEPRWTSKFHTSIFIALCITPEELLAEGYPTMEWATHPWIVELDRRFREELGMSLQEWANKTRDMVVAHDWARPEKDLFIEGARLIRDTAA